MTKQDVAYVHHVYRMEWHILQLQKEGNPGTCDYLLPQRTPCQVGKPGSKSNTARVPKLSDSREDSWMRLGREDEVSASSGQSCVWEMERVLETERGDGNVINATELCNG